MRIDRAVTTVVRLRVHRRGPPLVEQAVIARVSPPGTGGAESSTDLVQSWQRLAATVPWSGPCQLVLPSSQVVLRTLQLPGVPASRLGPLVAFELAQVLPYPVADAAWDYALTRAPDGGWQVVVAAWRQEEAQSLTVALTAAGWPVERVHPGPLCALRAHVSAAGADRPWALLDVAPETCHVLISDGGGVRLRSLPRYGLGSGDLEATAMGSSVARVLLQHRRDGGAAVRRLVWSGDDEGARLLREGLVSALHVPVDAGREVLVFPGDPPVVPPAIFHQRLAWAELSGATLPDAKHLGVPVIDLRPNVVRQRERRRRQWRRRVAATLGLVVALALPAAYHVTRARLAAQRSQAVATLAEPLRQANEAARQRERILAAPRARLRQLEQLAAAQRLWLDLLADLHLHLVASGEDAWIEGLEATAGPSIPLPAGERAGVFKALTQSSPALAGGRVEGARYVVRGAVVDAPRATGAAADGYGRAKRALDALAKSRYVLAVEQERFDATELAVVRFEARLVLATECAP